MISKTPYLPTEEDIEFLERIAATNPDSKELPEDPETAEALREMTALAGAMAEAALCKDYDAFVDMAHEATPIAIDAGNLCPELPMTIMAGYKMGIATGHANSANNLGSVYYLGTLAAQDYQKAADLYELGMDWGCQQSAINLGYIYEYGRTGSADYHKAFEYYAFAAAIKPHYEALYKLGDMYARGRAVTKDMHRAFALWDKSYEIARGVEEESQPAIRMAPLLLEDRGAESGAGYDPLAALHLYQTAEVGLRISISKGCDYYQKRLEEAMAGQLKARELCEQSEGHGLA